MATEPKMAAEVTWQDCLEYFKGILGRGTFGQVYKALWEHGKVIIQFCIELKLSPCIATDQNARGG